MKRPLLIGALGLVALCANAQKTLEQANYSILFKKHPLHKKMC